MLCPLCKENELEVRENKKGEQTLCCSEYKPMLADDDDKDSWQNFGECEFRIPFKNKVFGKMSLDDIKAIMSGDVVENSDGATIELDIDSKYFTKINFPTKKTKFEI